VGKEAATPLRPLQEGLSSLPRPWFPGAANALRAFTAEQRKLMDPGLVGIAEAGARLPVLDYLSAVREREAMGVTMNQFHRQWDLLLTPILPIPAFAAGREVPDGDAGKPCI